MNLIDCLSPERTLVGASASSKKKAYELLASMLANSCENLSEQDVLDALFDRERLGCTALGNGIAIPHGRHEKVTGVFCAVLLLEQGIDYDAKDKLPVDIFFALLVPEAANQEHLQCLSLIATLLREESFRRQLHNAYNNQALYDILVQGFQKQAALKAS